MTKVNITVLKCHIYRIIFPCKKLERTFKLNITLLCKTKTKTRRLFLSLSKFFLPHNQHLDFICLEYDDTVNLQSPIYSRFEKSLPGESSGGNSSAEIWPRGFTMVGHYPSNIHVKILGRLTFNGPKCKQHFKL